jgi:hypothetical protein
VEQLGHDEAATRVILAEDKEESFIQAD